MTVVDVTTRQSMLFDGATPVTDRWPCHRDICGRYWISPWRFDGRRVQLHRYSDRDVQVYYEVESAMGRVRQVDRQRGFLPLYRRWLFRDMARAVAFAGDLEVAINRRSDHA